MSITWNRLRAWGKDNSQNAAFEALCCQLAEYENVSVNSRFVRKGAPDAGLECYWDLPNASEWGWQAKFFTSPPDESQWQQIDDSVKTALGKHPQLTRITICLPIDRQDPRTPNENWFKNRWDQRVQKWTNLVSATGRKIDFDYWGEHEIFERLSRDEHRGRFRFWFDSTLLSKDWFKERWEESRECAGPRYSADLNIQLPIAQLFDALGRTNAFDDQIATIEATLRSTARKLPSRLLVAQAPNAPLSELRAHLIAASDMLSATRRDKFSAITTGTLRDRIEAAQELAWKLIEDLEVLKKQAKVSKPGEPSQSSHNHFDWMHDRLRDASRAVHDALEFCQGSDAELTNTCALCVTGKAGMGKTHLLCDVASNRLAAGYPTILLMGQCFTSNNEPWTQILQLLGLDLTRDEFLGALDAAAQAAGARTLLLIDALNEGDGRRLWPSHLPALLKSITRYRRLGVVISIRSSYETAIIREDLIPAKLVVTEHEGFGSEIYDATGAFFAHYGIAAPNVPLLNPEFNNPLFLKLLCDGLQKAGRTEVPLGFHGITRLFRFFIDAINGKLARQGMFHEGSATVWKAARQVAEAMTGVGQRCLPLEEVQQICNQVLPSLSYETSLFRHLLAEGLLSEGRIWSTSAKAWLDVVAFAYERLADHLLVDFLLSRHLASSAPEEAFQNQSKLGWVVADDHTCERNRGLLEALSIQLPEKNGKELPDVIGQGRICRTVREAFVEGLPWRDAQSIGEKTFAYINEVVLRYTGSRRLLLGALITVAANPEHGLNAEFLHRNLAGLKMPNRDSFWSVAIHEDYRPGSPTDRLIEWTSRDDDKSHFSDDSLFLAAKALTWLFTTSHRPLRDRATKALVRLLTCRIHLASKLIDDCRGVDDFYVLERLLAAVYGAVCRNPEATHLERIAQQVFGQFFKDGAPPPHVLLRDYARNIVELAIRQGLVSEVDVNLIRPPYKSQWPAMVVPSEDDLSKKFDWQNAKTNEQRSFNSIYASAHGMGDFARYEIEPEARIWSAQPRTTPRELSLREAEEMLTNSLGSRQKGLWYSLRKSITQERMSQDIRKWIDTTAGNVPQEQDAMGNQDALLSEFANSLAPNSRRLLEHIILPSLRNSINDQEDHFDVSLLKRWVVQRVLDLGWTMERFGAFDWNVRDTRGREANKPERIGKKYQWIALHEASARIADNFHPRHDAFDFETTGFDGPWQSFRRDIDPTCLLRRTRRDGEKPNQPSWWSPNAFDKWDLGTSADVWLQRTDDLPCIPKLLEVTNPNDGSVWLNLESLSTWTEPVPIGEERLESTRRELWFKMQGYVVKATDTDAFLKWAPEQQFYNDWMPHSGPETRVFLYEYFWSPAFRYHYGHTFKDEGWIDEVFGRHARLPAKVLLPSCQFMREHGTHDCSLDETVALRMPCKWICDRLGLVLRGDGQFCDKENRLVVYDPSVVESGRSCLLFRKDVFTAFLIKNGFTIFWTFLGERNILQDQMNSDRSKRSGRLVMNGGYALANGSIVGAFKSGFEMPE
jgi:hypothetical protein